MKLKELRINQGLTQLELSKLIGLTQSNYSKYENELASIDIGILKKLSKFYRVSIDYIVDNESKKQNTVELGLLNDNKKEAIQKIVMLPDKIATKINAYIDILTDREIANEINILKKLDE